MVDICNSNSKLHESIIAGKFVSMHGPRTAGKSTRMEQEILDLRIAGYTVMNISLQNKFNSASTIKSVWNSICFGIQAKYYKEVFTMHSGEEFVSLFDKKIVGNKKIVLFIDEFDVIASNAEVKDDILNTIRVLKEDRSSHCIHSMVVIGVYKIVRLNTSVGSPFNTSDAVVVPQLTFDGITAMFDYYISCRTGRRIDAEVYKDIFNLTNGHAGLVSMCGKAIDEAYFDGENVELTLNNWSRFYQFSFTSWIRKFPTMVRLIEDINKSSALKSFILNNVAGTEHFFAEGLSENIQELLSLGIIVQKGEFSYSMASPMIRRLLLADPQIVYDNIGIIPHNDLYNGHDSLNIKKALKCALSLITAANITNAKQQMFKKYADRFVPHEYFYQFHLAIIFRNNLNESWNVCIETKSIGSRKRVDLTIQNRNHADDPSYHYVIELMATDCITEERHHIDKTVEYGKMLNAANLWMLHCFCGELSDIAFHQRAKGGQDVHVLIACHSDEGAWNSFNYASLDPAIDWETLQI
jgi:hypothetical protein